jgi:hypothetical protein
MASDISNLWATHRSAGFPVPCPEDPGGVELHLLDGDTAGCISTFLTRGSLDIRRTAILGRCYRDLALVRPHLSGHARTYFDQLEQMAGLILMALSSSGELP